MAEEKDEKDSSDGATDKAKKSVGLFEKMGCCCLNLVVLFLILMFLSFFTIILDTLTNPVATFIKVVAGYDI